MNNPTAAQLSPSQIIAADTYYGDYVVTLLDTPEGTVTIMQELDELTLNMSIE